MKLFLHMLQYPFKCGFCLGTAGTISNNLTIHNLGFTTMTVSFSLGISRREFSLVQDWVLPHSTVTAIIAAVPWLQMLKQLQRLTLSRDALDRKILY